MSVEVIKIEKEFKSLLKQNLQEEEFNLWVNPLIIMAPQGEELTLACPNSFHLSFLKNNYFGMLQNKLKELDEKLKLKFTVLSSANLSPLPAPSLRQQSLPLLQNFKGLNLNPRFIFDRFVSGQSNEFAFAAARALAEGKQIFSNTLFIASSTGLGKTHLTQAIGHQFLCHAPQSRIAYLTAEDFTNQMISGLRSNRIEAFKDRFRRDCDLLLLEEIQFLVGKDKTQDELSYTLDALMDSGKKIVFTSNCPPHEIDGLKPQLISRLCSGITTAITPPDHSTRIRILQKYCQAEDINIAPEVLEFLAQEAYDDIRRLHSALVGVVAKSSLTGRDIDIKLANEVLCNMMLRLKRVSPQAIMAEVAQSYGLDSKDLSGKSRRRQITKPRNLAMFLCRKHTDVSYAGLGKLFGRNHATVIYGVEQIERNLSLDSKISQEIHYIEQRLGLS
ncbi:MAG: chromosomal replication initiator protein DnaA [Desulfarculales bacterium]|nr:chromosomal replication initiator protein DnaA [Desulfarculales bacterium]